MDKLLVLTGGSRGIGAATLARFRNEGWRCINLSRKDCYPVMATQLTCDFSEPEWPVNHADALRKLVGEPDQICLVHNAALLLKDNVRDAAYDLGRVMQINLVAPQQLNELLVPQMSEGSSILYVGSTLSEKAVANTLSYSVSKHALLGLMRATCQDLAGTGIHSACICPGFTDTEMLRDHVGRDEAILQALGSSDAFGRLVQPQEIAETLLFASNNPAINGATLHVNLGQIEH